MSNVDTKQGQCIWDIAIQETGNVETAFDFALTNNISVTDPLIVATPLSYTEVEDNKVLKYYTENSIYPATGLTVASGGIHTGNRAYSSGFSIGYN